MTFGLAAVMIAAVPLVAQQEAPAQPAGKDTVTTTVPPTDKKEIKRQQKQAHKDEEAANSQAKAAKEAAKAQKAQDKAQVQAEKAANKAADAK
jgi:hypothetical protein